MSRIILFIVFELRGEYTVVTHNPPKSLTIFYNLLNLIKFKLLFVH